MIKSVSPVQPIVRFRAREMKLPREAKPRMRLEEYEPLSKLQDQAEAGLRELIRFTGEAYSTWQSRRFKESARIKRVRRLLGKARKRLHDIKLIGSRDEDQRPLWYLREDIKHQAIRLHGLWQEVEALVQAHKQKYQARAQRRTAKR